MALKQFPMGSLVKRFWSLPVFFLSLLLPSFGMAQQTLLVKQLGNWGVYKDNTIGGACFIGTNFTDGTIFRLGYWPKGSDNFSYLLMANEKWTSIRSGQKYLINVTFDNLKPSLQEGMGWVVEGNKKGVLINSTDPSYIMSLTGARWAEASYEGNLMVSLRLENFDTVVAELIACRTQSEFDQGTGRNDNDPFAKPKPRLPKSDPFAL